MKEKTGEADRNDENEEMNRVIETLLQEGGSTGNFHGISNPNFSTCVSAFASIIPHHARTKWVDDLDRQQIGL